MMTLLKFAAIGMAIAAGMAAFKGLLKLLKIAAVAAVVLAAIAAYKEYSRNPSRFTGHAQPTSQPSYDVSSGASGSPGGGSASTGRDDTAIDDLGNQRHVRPAPAPVGDDPFKGTPWEGLANNPNFRG